MSFQQLPTPLVTVITSRFITVTSTVLNGIHFEQKLFLEDQDLRSNNGFTKIKYKMVKKYMKRVQKL